MKKFILLSTLIFLISSCSKEGNDLEDKPKVKTEEWWCFALDYGDQDENNWCPKASFCDCNSEVVVTPGIAEMAHDFHESITNSEYISEFASSSDWEILFESTNFPENEILPVIRECLINQEYAGVNVESHAGVTYYILLDSGGEALYTLRLKDL